MAHFALLDNNNRVVQVLVGRDDDDGKEAELTARTGQQYRQTSYNTQGGVHKLGGTPFRKNYAGIGYTFDAGRDAFIPPKPYNSWVLNETTCRWEAPTPMPEDLTEEEIEAGTHYSWNEETTSWDKVTRT